MVIGINGIKPKGLLTFHSQKKAIPLAAPKLTTIQGGKESPLTPTETDFFSNSSINVLPKRLKELLQNDYKNTDRKSTVQELIEVMKQERKLVWIEQLLARGYLPDDIASALQVWADARKQNNFLGAGRGYF